jgi:cyclase
MNSSTFSRPTTRRELLRTGSAFLGAGVIAGFVPRNLFAFPQSQSGSAQQTGAAPSDVLAQMRAQMALVPLETLKLRDNIYMLHGPGGNMVVLNGPDGKVLVDSSFASVAPKLKQSMDVLGSAPLKVLINTHWHFDHTDGNQAMHEFGAMILAHENTRKRLSTPQTVAALGLHFDASPAAALPQQTFSDAFKLYFNGEELALSYVPPAHTDTDIFIRYQEGNVLHMGDLWFNGTYPFIDASTGGNINGMIAGASRGIGLTDADTKIVPGHGPLGDRAALTKFRDMLATVRDRVQTLKSSGKSLQDVIAAKPTADLDEQWGKGFMKPDFFVTIVYQTL